MGVLIRIDRMENHLAKIDDIDRDRILLELLTQLHL